MRLLFLIGIVALFIFSACGESMHSRVDRLKQEGAGHFSQQNYSSAIQKWEKAIEITPNDAALLKKIGNAYLHLADWQRALKAYKDALAWLPHDTEILLCVGKIHLLQMDIKAAEQAWEQLKDAPYKNSSLYVFHGDLLVIKQNLYLAELDYRQALTIDQNNFAALIKLATCLLAQEKKEAALEMYSRLDAMHPEEASILVQMANYWMLSGDYKRAELLCLKAMEIDSKDLHLRYKLAELYYGAEQYDKAIGVLEGRATENPSLLYYNILLVESYLKLGYLAKAESCLEEIEKTKPNNIDIAFLKGKYHLMARNPVNAISHFEFVLDREPKMVQAHYLLGLAYLAAGHNNLGYQSLIKALSLDNMYTDAELALADYYYKHYAYDSALEHASRIAAREPENYRVQLIMGNILLAQEQFDIALICFQKAHMINQASVSPLYFAAIVAEKSGADEKALRLYQAIIEKHPEMIDVSARYAQLLINRGKAETAKAYFLAQLKEGIDNNGFIHYLLGKICLVSKDLESARIYFQASVEKNPGNSMAYMELAGIYHTENAIEKEIIILKSVIKHNSQQISAYINLASAQLLNGNTENAIQTLKEGLIINPHASHLKNNLAVLYLNRDENINIAFELAQSAYQEMANEPSVSDTLGWAYYKKGLYRQAEWYIREAVRLGGWEAGSPEGKEAGKLGGSETGGLEISMDAEQESGMVRKSTIIDNGKSDNGLAMVRYHLGLVLKAKGDDVGAKKSLERALEVGLHGAFRRDAERVLAILSGRAEDASKLVN